MKILLQTISFDTTFDSFFRKLSAAESNFHRWEQLTPACHAQIMTTEEVALGSHGIDPSSTYFGKSFAGSILARIDPAK